MKPPIIRLLPLLIFLLVAVFFLRGLSLDPHQLPLARLGAVVPVFSLPDLIHPKQKVDDNQLKGEIALLNVWASWCEACGQEQWFLLQLASEGVPIYGINYKDEHASAIQWLSTWGNPYRMIAEDERGLVAIDLGVYGTPETFLLDKKGVIRHRYAGALTEEIWQKEFKPLMVALEKQS